jgi:peptide/nickel transport system permease protein
MGMAGLGVLVFFVAVAVFAIFADDAGTSRIHAEGPILAGPSWGYPMGTDEAGRSVLTLVIHGTPVSLMVGLSATLITIVVGTLVGIVAGYRGKATDVVLMRVTDWGLAIPWLVLAIALAAVFGQSLYVIILVIGLTTWPSTARLVRSQALSIKERAYVERARALGAGTWHMIGRHVLPNVMPIVMANAVLIVAVAILSETALSFLGLGDPLRITWGQILEQASNGQAATGGWWWWLFFPGLCIVLVVLSFTMIGFALDEIINPKLRKR